MTNKTPKPNVKSRTMTINMPKYELLSTIWNQPRYYEFSNQFDNEFVTSYWFKLIKKHATNAKSILDLGCGEGTILSQLATPDQRATGVDISPLAIKTAREKYPNLNFVIADAENLPFDDNFFDFCYNVATLEHLSNPERVIEEMIRVTQKNGLIAFWALNFGSPFVNPSSSNPSFSCQTIKRTVLSLLYLVSPPRSLKWKKISPKFSSIETFSPDDDLTCEPYMQTLVSFLRKNNLKIIIHRSGWEILEKESTKKWLRILCKTVNQTGISKIQPFCYWGNALFVVAQKN